MRLPMMKQCLESLRSMVSIFENISCYIDSKSFWKEAMHVYTDQSG